MTTFSSDDFLVMVELKRKTEKKPGDKAKIAPENEILRAQNLMQAARKKKR